MRQTTRIATLASLALICGFAGSTPAQVPPSAAPDQLAMLKDPDPKLARNKQFVFDFWRIVYEGRHVDQAPKYMAESYIQHNPNVVSGRAAFQNLFGKMGAKPIEPLMKMQVISISADGDYVTVATVRRMRDTKDPSHIYATTWFDMFRIDSNGMIAEHWDPSPLWIDGKPPGAEFLP